MESEEMLISCGYTELSKSVIELMAMAQLGTSAHSPRAASAAKPEEVVLKIYYTNLGDHYRHTPLVFHRFGYDEHGASILDAYDDTGALYRFNLEGPDDACVTMNMYDIRAARRLSALLPPDTGWLALFHDQS